MGAAVDGGRLRARPGVAPDGAWRPLGARLGVSPL
jgi:hypothetical protein